MFKNVYLFVFLQNNAWYCMILQSIKAESKKKLTLLKMEQLDKNKLTIWDILVGIKIFKNIHGKINLKKES